VVHFVLALPTVTAVRDLREFVVIANFAMVMGDAVVIVVELLILLLTFVDFTQFRQCIFDPHGLNIAQKAHEDVEIGE
jgi:hypothetical protein